MRVPTFTATPLPMSQKPKQMDLTNYIAYYHTGSECLYPQLLKLHPALETRFIMDYQDQNWFLNNKNPIIGLVVAVGMMTIACILVASYKNQGVRVESN